MTTQTSGCIDRLTIKRFDDAWVAASSNLSLLVPSVVASEEKKLMLNPLHSSAESHLDNEQ
jgi:RES domain-containing protein